MKRLIATFISLFLIYYIHTLSSITDFTMIAEPVGAVKTVKISVDNFLYSYRLYALLFFALVIAWASVKEEIWDFRKNFQEVIYNQLKDIREDCFPTNRSEIRITVFKKANWFEASLHYVYHTYVKFIKIRLLPEKNIFSSLRWFPRTFSHYLIIFSRLGSPSQTIHSTIFRIVDDENQIEGVVGLAWKNNNYIKINLPDIRNNEKLRKFNKLDLIEESQEKKDIIEYMQKGNILTYKKLKTMHRHSISFWAKVILDPSRERWGVLIIDSSAKDIIEQCNDEKINQYAEKIQEIVNRYYRYL